MILRMKQLFDIPGENQDINYEITKEEIRELNSSRDFVTPIAVNGRAFNRAGVVTLEYNCKFTLAHVCDRCLEEFEREYSYDFSHIVVNGSTKNDDYIVSKDNALDLNELAISDLLLQLPTKILCSEDCKGLCYVCGQNLNEGKCNCS